MSDPALGILGVAPHSGWAAAVLIAGTADAPRVVLRERLELCDARLAGSRQPYHELEGLPLGEARRRLVRFETSATRAARSALTALRGRARAVRVEPRAVGILDSSGRSGVPLAAILASHALIHTADGNHFRDALERAAFALGMSVQRIPQRELTAQAAPLAMRRSPEELAESLKALGRGLGSPWGADQKSAALFAWLLLAQGP